MGWFDSKKTKTETEHLSGSAAARKIDGVHDAEIIKDAFSKTLKILGEFALPTQRISAPEFVCNCERWARQILLQNEKASGTEESKSLHDTLREILATVREQRKEESTEYCKHRDSAQIIVADLVGALRKSLANRENKDRETISLLSEMETAVEQGNLAAIRSICARTAGHIKEVIAVQRDEANTQLTQLSNQLRSMREELAAVQADMQRDALTDTLNRGAFEEAFSKSCELAHASAVDLSLFMIDLDHFKKVNDTWGHPAGDRVLKLVAKQLIRCFPRKDDMVVRYGGEEFVVLCNHTCTADAPMLAERARRAVAAMIIPVEDTEHVQTISVGYASLCNGETPDQFLKRADQALYKAKNEGRNRIMTICPQR